MPDQFGDRSSGIEIIKPDWPAPGNVRAFTTTRNDGFSQDQWAGLNLGDHCGDDTIHVQKNRGLLRAMLPSEPLWLSQVHGTKAVSWDESYDSAPEADAVVSNRSGQVCAVLTADCLPVLFCDKAGTVVAAAHAGWRGLATGVLEATISAMPCDSSELIAWLGPAIGPQSFEVGDDVYNTFVKLNTENTIAFKRSGDRWLADLYELARLELIRAGIGQVSGARHCTFSESERFFSYRRDGVTGRMATLVWMEAR